MSNRCSTGKSRCPLAITFDQKINRLLRCWDLGESVKKSYVRGAQIENVEVNASCDKSNKPSGHLKLHEKSKTYLRLKTWRILFSNNLTTNFSRSKTLTRWFYKGLNYNTKSPQFSKKTRISQILGYYSCSRARKPHLPCMEWRCESIKWKMRSTELGKHKTYLNLNGHENDMNESCSIYQWIKQNSRGNNLTGSVDKIRWIIPAIYKLMKN